MPKVAQKLLIIPRRPTGVRLADSESLDARRTVHIFEDAILDRHTVDYIVRVILTQRANADAVTTSAGHAVDNEVVYPRTAVHGDTVVV